MSIKGKAKTSQCAEIFAYHPPMHFPNPDTPLKIATVKL